MTETVPQPRKGIGTLRQRQRILQMLIFSLVTIMIWVAFSLLRSQRKTAISTELRNLAKPLTPTINRTVLDEIEQMKSFSSSELSQFPIYTIIISEETGFEQVVTKDERERQLELLNQPSPSPSPSVSPSPSPSPEVEAAATATPAATQAPVIENDF